LPPSRRVIKEALVSAQTHAFQAEVSKVLDLVIHSLYTSREIFLRELISNASDALDKLRFRAITEPDLMDGEPSLEIRLGLDKEKRTLTIEDTGVGMSEEDLMKGLGTVAYSGSRSFLEELAAKKGAESVSLIGQFGVGFYSAYLVADRVEVLTRAAGPGAKGLKWSSDAKSTFTIEPCDRAARGTQVVLHLKEAEFAEAWKVKDLVKRYSDYVTYPIKLEGEQINQAKALWQRPKSEVEDEEYDEFYKHLTHDFEPPLARTHFRAEGKHEFVGLLYVPRHRPFDLQDGRRRRGVRLFVRRVFVMDDCEELVPAWLRFVRGVVDSEDLPLNVSREVLQDSALPRSIRGQITKKTLDLLDAMAKERAQDYAAFWGTFGSILKEGIATGDMEHKEHVAALLRYPSTATTGEALTSLDEYVARMPGKQEAIYYLYGEDRKTLEGSPYLEALRARGYEALFMTDPVDQWAADGLDEYKGKKLVSAMRADLPLGDEAKEEQKKAAEVLKPLCERIQKVLEAQVREVRPSERLVDSPACLVLAPGATPALLERLLKERGKNMPHVKRVLEINPKHPLIEALAGAVAQSSERADEWIELLYEQALVTEGAPLDDPNRFARRIAALLTEVATRGTKAASSG
jgi:molecular chaperone HtpG